MVSTSFITNGTSSSFNSTSTGCDFQQDTRKSEAFLFILIALVTFCGSLLVIGCYIRHRCLRHSTNVFIMSLTASDFLVAVLSLPYSFGVFMCHWQPLNVTYLICDMLPSILSIYSLCLVALDRALAISNPFFHNKYVNIKSASVAVGSVWLFVASFVAFLYILSRNQFTLFIIFMSYGIPVTIMVCCYIVIGYIGRKPVKALTLIEKTSVELEVMNRREENTDRKFDQEDPAVRITDSKECENTPVVVTSPTRNPPRRRLTVTSERRGTLTWMRKAFCRKMSQVVTLPEKRSSLNLLRRELKAAIHLSLLLTVFVVAWTPFMALNIRLYICEDLCDIDFQLVKYFKLLHYSNSAFNPFLYVLLNKRWRRALVSVLCWRQQGGRVTDETISQLDDW